jgi:hypothetical protein
MIIRAGGPGNGPLSTPADRGTLYSSSDNQHQQVIPVGMPVPDRPRPATPGARSLHGTRLHHTENNNQRHSDVLSYVESQRTDAAFPPGRWHDRFILQVTEL